MSQSAVKCTVVTGLDMEVNAEKSSLSITTEKMVKICCKHGKAKKNSTKRQLQSLLGHLLYIHQCVKPARYCLNRMLGVHRNAHNASRICFNLSFHRDLR